MHTRFEFSASPTVLARQLEHYLDTHPDETCTLLGLPAGTAIGIEVVNKELPIKLRQDTQSATLRIGERDAQRVIAYTRSCNWASGIALVPTLARLVCAGAFSGLQAGIPRAIRSLVMVRQPDPARNLGVAWGALNLLGLAGWVTLSGADEHAEYALTPAGECVVACVERVRPLFELLANAASILQHLHALCHRTRENTADSARYAQLARICMAGWSLPAPTNDVERHVDWQLRTAMDGLLLGPTWVALDMPVFGTPQNGQCSQTAPSILDKLDCQPDGVAMSAWTDTDQVVLRAAWSLMHTFGMVEIAQEKVWLTEAGWIHRPIAAPYAGLPASHLRSYALLDELLFGNPDPLDIDRDGHIDRVMNVYASSRGGSEAALQEIEMKVLRKLFDDTPLDQQPAGIADMVCGDGSTVKCMAEYITRATRRGRHLADYPLLVIGADDSKSARDRAQETLSELSAVPGVLVRVIAADISQPDRYDDAVAESGLTVKPPGGSLRPARLSDLLHTFMFQTHNRRLRVRREAVAEAILERQLGKVDRSHLRAVVDQCYPGKLTVSDRAEPPMTLDDVKNAFRVAYSDVEGLVPGYVAAADLIDLVLRWKHHAQHGLVIAERHSPWAADLYKVTPDCPDRWTRTEQLPSVFNWGAHFLSREFMMPFNEFMLVMALAGLRPNTPIHGRLHPEGFPSPDLLDEYRFISIANYVNVPS
ncbi:hypothetical protein [Burkholderia ubonensis]|uniref:AprA-related methyltransferase n=1 Tax=Burkholderia ubonensis TaxID=101571 RepID=UPI000751F756|nr:hypothetical protein [Burkholderia ubonensis]KVC71779.1 hypothetical protein WI75_25700 [Burkholderia ubonensis]